MGLDYMEKELLRLYAECEPCYDKFLEDVQRAVCSIEYGRGGELFHRGYYLPSPFFDLVVGNANRGRLVKRPRKGAVYDYIYYKDQAGNLIMVDKYSGNTDADKELYYREFIIKSGSREIAPCFEFYKFLGQINIVSLSLCEYSDGKIILYRNMLRPSTKKEDGTVSYIHPSMRRITNTTAQDLLTRLSVGKSSINCFGKPLVNFPTMSPAFYMNIKQLIITESIPSHGYIRFRNPN